MLVHESNYYPTPQNVAYNQILKKVAITLLVLGIIASVSSTLMYLKQIPKYSPFELAIGGGSGILASGVVYTAESRHWCAIRPEFESQERFKEQQTELEGMILHPEPHQVPVFPAGFNEAKIDQAMYTGNHRFAGSGTNIVISHPDYPHFVFKKYQGTPPPGHTMQRYVEQSERAQALCAENNLHLLLVPKARAISDRIVVQEKLDLVEGWESLAAIYSWGSDNPRLEAHFKELFRQLTIFVCKFKFSDVKLNNIPLTKEGRVALIDLDENSASIGLTKGRSNGFDGLFRVIPHKWLAEFTALAYDLLNEEQMGYVSAEMVTLQNEAIARQQKLEALQKFHQGVSARQPICFSRDDFETREDAFVAERIIAFVNEKLSQIPIPLTEARKVWVDASQAYLPFRASLGSAWSVDRIWEVLAQLKAKGYIYDYSKDDYHSFPVVC